MKIKPVRVAGVEIDPIKIGVFLIVVAFLAGALSLPGRPPGPGRSYYFILNDNRYNFTKIYANQSAWQRGLSNYSNLSSNTFALFIFPSASNYSFWMKNTYISLDIIWVAGNKVVYYVTAQPCSSYDTTQSRCVVYTPSSAANYVIETKAGFAKRNNISSGAIILIRQG